MPKNNSLKKTIAVTTASSPTIKVTVDRETSEKATVVIAPNGNRHPVNSPDEGVRFMAILANGYLDVDVVKLTNDLENGDVEEYTFGGWKLSIVDASGLPKSVGIKYKLTNGDKVELVSSIEAISHVCDCSINSISTRLTETPEGFTAKGWFVEKVDGAQ
jgi:hypothetical protein